MNLYYFNPNDYGQEFYVMAETEDDARAFLLAEAEKEPEYRQSIRNAANLTGGYTIEEYGPGEVLRSDRC